MSDYNLNRLNVNQIYSTFSNQDCTLTEGWIRKIFWQVLAFFGGIGQERQELVQDRPKPSLFNFHENESKSGEEKIDSGRERLIEQGLIPDPKSEEDSLLNKMIIIENSLLAGGAKPGKDYTYLDLVKSAQK